MTKKEYLELVSKETTRMGQPGSFYGRVLKRKNKKSKDKACLPVHNYFLNDFPIKDIWEYRRITEQEFEKWHKLRLEEIAKVINDNYLFKTEYDPMVIGAKFIDTFMHQLIKYSQCRSVYEWLHLPLDNTVLKRLRNMLGKKYRSAYEVDYNTYQEFQKGLWADVKKYNKQLKEAGIKLRSRINLNAILWAGE